MKLCMLALVMLAGCAARRPDDDDARPGEACESAADCNRVDGGTRSCGVLRLCVAGRCESDAGSRAVACTADASR